MILISLEESESTTGIFKEICKSIEHQFTSFSKITFP